MKTFVFDCRLKKGNEVVEVTVTVENNGDLKQAYKSRDAWLNHRWPDHLLIGSYLHK